ncbi:RHS repeat-associated core domain-containing protein, partial [Marinilabiliaceae bacterium JC017]
EDDKKVEGNEISQSGVLSRPVTFENSNKSLNLRLRYYGGTPPSEESTLQPQLIASNTYYPFGMTITSLSAGGEMYRYGFNGKEKDDQGEWGMTHYDYGFRIYNPGIARFLSVDPLTKSYPWYTPYQFAGNKPIWAIDLDGMEEYKVTRILSEDMSVRSTKLELVDGRKTELIVNYKLIMKETIVDQVLNQFISDKIGTREQTLVKSFPIDIYKNRWLNTGENSDKYPFLISYQVNFPKREKPIKKPKGPRFSERIVTDPMTRFYISGRWGKDKNGNTVLNTPREKIEAWANKFIQNNLNQSINNLRIDNIDITYGNSTAFGSDDNTKRDIVMPIFESTFNRLCPNVNSSIDNTRTDLDGKFQIRISYRIRVKEDNE